MLVTLSFADLQSGIWGVLWDLDEGRFALVGDAAEGAATPADATVSGSDPDSSWQVSGGGIELEASPEGEAAELGTGFDQLVRVRGRWAIDGTERLVDCFGRRGTRDGIDPARFEAVRDVSAWFEPDLGMALVAARPRGSAGHDGDVVSACVLEADRAMPVIEPRLSTTYSASGQPARASLELWLEDPGQEHDEDERVERFPRRAAGEAIGAAASASNGFLTAQAGLFRWHSRGREGAGVYILAQLLER